MDDDDYQVNLGDAELRFEGSIMKPKADSEEDYQVNLGDEPLKFDGPILDPKAQLE